MNKLYLIVSIFGLSACSPGPPSDDELTNTFTKHMGQFIEAEQLCYKYKDLRQIGIDEATSETENGKIRLNRVLKKEFYSHFGAQFHTKGVSFA